MFMKLLIYALKVVRLDRALNRTPLSYKSNALPIWLCRYMTSNVTNELHIQTWLPYIKPQTSYMFTTQSPAGSYINLQLYILIMWPSAPTFRYSFGDIMRRQQVFSLKMLKRNLFTTHMLKNVCISAWTKLTGSHMCWASGSETWTA